MRFPFDLPIEWSGEKDRILRETRGISSEEVEKRLSAYSNVLEIFPHPNRTRYPRQTILVINIDEFAWIVPFVVDTKNVFLKTMYKSRKYTEKYLHNQ